MQGPKKKTESARVLAKKIPKMLSAGSWMMSEILLQICLYVISFMLFHPFVLHNEGHLHETPIL